MINTIWLDLDDTLIHNAYSYHVPQLDAAKIICVDLMWHAPSPRIMMDRAIEIQLEDIEKKQAVTKSCFPNSWIQVYKELCQKFNRAPNDQIIGAIALSTEKYFLEKYHVFPKVKETLQKIQDKNIKKICVTRGDYDIQYYKISSTLLEGYFDEIEIVPIKTTETYNQILDKYKLIPNETAMLGDSLKNDILPALQCGLHAFHLTEDNQKQEWDDPNGLLSVNKLDKRFYKPIKSIEEVLDYLDQNNTN